LLDALARRVGSPRARFILGEALARTDRTVLPEDVGDLIAFTKAHLIDDLVGVLGVHDALMLLEELGTAPSGVQRIPATGPAPAAIALVDHDRLRRADMARALIGRRFDVQVADDLHAAATLLPRPAVFVVEYGPSLGSDLRRAFGNAQPPAIVLRLCASLMLAIRALEQASVAVHEHAPAGTPSEIVRAVERALRRLTPSSRATLTR